MLQKSEYCVVEAAVSVCSMLNAGYNASAHEGEHQNHSYYGYLIAESYFWLCQKLNTVTATEQTYSMYRHMCIVFEMQLRRDQCTCRMRLTGCLGAYSGPLSMLIDLNQAQYYYYEKHYGRCRQAKA